MDATMINSDAPCAPSKTTLTSNCADDAEKPMSNVASATDVAAVAVAKVDSDGVRADAPSPKRARIEPEVDNVVNVSHSNLPQSANEGKKLVVSFQGTIGAGKTTQLTALREFYKNDPSVMFVDEPLDEWQEYRLLEFMYNGLEANKDAQPLGDNALDPCSFQTVALATRVARLHQALSSPKVQVVICERSPEADKYVFAEATLKTTAQRNAYKLVYDKVLSMLPPFVNHHFLLKLDPASAKLRICKRARPEEQSISLEYLAMLDKGHKSLIESVPEHHTTFDAGMDRDELSKTILVRIEALKAE